MNNNFVDTGDINRPEDIEKQFADSNIWDNIIEKAYSGVKIFGIYDEENKDCKIKLCHFNSILSGNFLTTAPYATDGGFIYKDIKTREILVEKAVSLCKKLNVDYLLIKIREPINTKGFYNYDKYVTFVLDLTRGIDDVWNNKIESKTRNQIRKARKQDYKVKISNESIDDFYKVASRALRDLGTPVIGKNFFLNILKYFQESFIITIYDNEKPISSSIVIIKNNTIFHPFAYTLNKYKKFSVNDQLYWEIIKFGIEKKCERFNGGRSKINSGNYRYKKQWGGDIVPLYYNFYLNKSKAIPVYAPDVFPYTLYTKIWKRLPIRIANFLGPILSRYFYVTR